MRFPYTLLLAILFLFASCNQVIELDEINGNKESNTIKVRIDSKGKGVSPVQVNTVSGDFSGYEKALLPSDSYMTISSSRYYPMKKERITIDYCPASLIHSPSLLAQGQQEKLYIDGLPLELYENDEVGMFRGKFGTRVDICNGGFLGTKSGQNDSDSTQFYIPQILRISFPDPSLVGDRAPLCYYKDYVVRWNADDNNENGVIITVRWTGTMIFGDDYPATSVMHTVCVPDTGSATLDESFFDQIPDAAYCTLVVARGSADEMNTEGGNLTILAETHDVINFILLRYVIQTE